MKQVIVFHQNGCPACHNYLPRFRRKAVKYRAFVNIQLANISRNQKALVAADKYKVKAVPTTVVLDASDKLIKKIEGAIDDAKIVELLESAAK